MFTPVRFRLPFHTDREAPQVARCDNPKKYSSRLPPALGRSSAKSHSSLWKCTPKKYSRQTASGFGSIPCEKSHQPSELCSEKTFRPGRLQLWGDPLRKATPAFGNVPRKNIPARQPPALGRYPAKSPTSLRNCALKRRSGQAASSFGEILCEKPLQPLEMYPEKIFPPDSLRLLVNPFRKISPAACCDNPKKYSSRLPSAFGQSFSKNLSSGPLRRPEKVQLQTAFGFWSILFEKSLQRPAAMARKSTAPDSLRLWIYTEQKVSPAFGDVPQPFASGCRL